MSGHSVGKISIVHWRASRLICLPQRLIRRLRALFSAIDVGCGAGTTSMALADAAARCFHHCLRPFAVLGADRGREDDGVAIGQGRARQRGGNRGERRAFRPLLFSSRRDVLSGPCCVRFARLSRAANPGSSLVFSCFQGLEAKMPGHLSVASETAGREISPPGREPSGFAFCRPGLCARNPRGLGAGCQWDVRVATFDYVAGEGCHAVDQAISLLSRDRTSLGVAQGDGRVRPQTAL